MQGHGHHHQQQLAALLAAALPREDNPPPARTTSPSSSSDEADEASRLAALDSLHRAILHPHNALLVAHSSSFLSQGLSQLLSDKSYSLRRLSAIVYGTLCSVVCSSLLGPNGSQNHVIVGSIVDSFISWALPLIGGEKEHAELALEGLREFLSNGDPNGVEGYVLPILEACQELLEDERTSLNLLPHLLGVVSLISLKFMQYFQPHFMDIVDLLLGWALVPDLPDSDRSIIMDSFLQFKKHWLNNLQFPLGLLSKFLDDMEAMLNDTCVGGGKQFRRLLALLSCFSTVLQVTAYGLSEMDLLGEITGPMTTMLPQLLTCLFKVGNMHGWSNWDRESWKCLTLMTEILGERFSTFYPAAFDVLFGSLRMDKSKPTSSHVHGVLNLNLQMLSLQGSGLQPSSVEKILKIDSSLSQLRLHPNHRITCATAFTYIFLIRHGSKEVAELTLKSLMREVEELRRMYEESLENKLMFGLRNINLAARDSDLKLFSALSELELLSLLKFDVSILLSGVFFENKLVDLEQRKEIVTDDDRLGTIISFIFENLCPFKHPVNLCVDLQVHVLKTLEKLSEVDLLSKFSVRNSLLDTVFVGHGKEIQNGTHVRKWQSSVIFEHMSKYSGYIIRALHASSPLAVKVAALEWIHGFCEIISVVNKDMNLVRYCQPSDCVRISNTLLSAILDAASDKELKIRTHIAKILELLLQAKLIDPHCFSSVAEVVLDRLGDPESTIKISFVKILSIIMLLTVYTNGVFEDEVVLSSMSHGNKTNLKWKLVFAIQQLPQQLHSQQLVTILSYLSQRWKVALSSWIQRLVSSCRGSSLDKSSEQRSHIIYDSQWMDMKIDEDMLERICSVNSLAAVWWAIHEAARYCVIVRLRTNLGGPAQTFASLERMLLDVSHTLQLDTNQSEANLNVGSSASHLLPMRLLLDFVEALKKNVYNAYEGSCVLPSGTRQSLQFFRANKKVCEEWFSRICEPMINAGLALQCHAAVVQYCLLRLQDLKHIVDSVLVENSRMQSENLHSLRTRFTGEVLSVLRYASLALCRNHESEALVGLQKWVAVTFSFLFREENLKVTPFSESFGHLSWITGLVYQAQGQYEKACAHFSHLLQSEEALKLMGSDGVQFVISRIIENYSALSDWKSLEVWLLELQALRARHAGKSYCGALTTAGSEMNAIYALARFDEGDIQSAWSYLDLTPKSSNDVTLDPNLAIRRSEQILLQALMFQKDGKLDKVLKETEKGKRMLEEALSLVSLDGQSESAAYAAQLHCIYAFEEQYQKEQNPSSLMLGSIEQVVQFPINKVHQNCSIWLKLFRIYHTIHPTSLATLNLGQNLMALARKQENYMMAHRLNNLIQDNLVPAYVGKDKELLMTNMHYERILLMHAEKKHEDALMNLWDLVRPWFKSVQQVVVSDPGNILKSMACLKLSKWLRQEYSFGNFRNIIFKICSDINEASDYEACNLNENSILGRDGHLMSDEKCHLILEEIVGRTIKLSTILCPTMCKSWLLYASWCYDQANGTLFAPETVPQACSASPLLQSEIVADRFRLTEEEILRIERTVLKIFVRTGDTSNALGEIKENIIASDASIHLNHESSLKHLVDTIMHLVQTAAGAPGVDNSDGEPPSAILASQLQLLLLSTHVELEEQAFKDLLEEVIDIWWSLRKRRVSLFGHAAHGFLQYLSHSSTNLLVSTQGGLHQKTSNCNLRATLYILHILSNFGLELKDTFEASLESVPLLPWQEITPQLFARLSSHPQRVVRNILKGLLLMLAKLSPWSIVFPTLVDVNAYEGQPSEELLHIMGCLNKLYPKLILDVQLVINELGVVTVLWEEQWLATLQDLHTDVIRRINLLKEETARVAENVTLSRSEKSKINAARYSAVMAPIIVALERRLASTSRKAETAHEKWFQDEYGEQLKSAILRFKSPPLSSALLGDVWRPFDAIAASLANNHRKSSVLLKDVAPQLSLLSSSDVPMPGMERQISISRSYGRPSTEHQGLVTISSFCEQVTILSTKTKPKKLILLGSDGRKYTYLLKGREDLRLDARIMQLLQAINSFLHSYSDTRSRSVAIRYYSVTPISGRAGLIQWVENVISIYSVFKSWQNRAQLAQSSAIGATTTNNTIPPVPGPSDMFYGKIIPALKEKGIRRVISRKDWPHDVKRKVLLDLMKETPSQLLYQEIWCSSGGFKAFSSKLNRFSGSVAAMSMVGHVLGLGDRHLDNILIDFYSGDIVHIDYNICFDKGKRLKIPEIVPFRLTQTIESALGLTGIEGTFRANCEAVVGVLRKNKDVILMLLDVFVWDPLVEWTRGDGHDEAAIGGEERKGMELAVSLSLFASRIHEIRVPLQEHHDLLLSTVPAAESALERFLAVLNQYEVVSSLFYCADLERSNLIIHEKSAKSLVAEATSNAENSRATFEVQIHEFAQTEAVLTEKAQEAAIWMEHHGRIIDALRTGSISEINSHLPLSSLGEALSLASAVVTAGVPLSIVPEPTLAQCQDLDREISQLVVELDNGLLCAIKALQEYAMALQRVLPLNYVTTSPVHGWVQALQLVVRQLSSDSLSFARMQATDLLARSEAEDHNSIHKFHEELCLKVEKYVMNIEKIEEECLELMNSIGSETKTKSKDSLISSFMKYMQTVDCLKKDDWPKDLRSEENFEEKKAMLTSILHLAAFAVYDKVKGKLLNIRSNLCGRVGWKQGDNTADFFAGITFGEFEEQVEKCVLVAGFVSEMQKLLGADISNPGLISEPAKYPFRGNWASDFQACLVSCRIAIKKMTEVALPEIIRSVISYNLEAMDAFGSLSQIRGSIDTIFEQLMEIQLERASLLELEQSYFIKVGLITEQQLALEEAALEGRDHLSWEEAEELATQEEACKAQLNKLHQMWNEKDIRSSSLEKRETNLQHALLSAERLFSSSISVEQGGDYQKSKGLLATLSKPFYQLESVEEVFFTLASNRYLVELPNLSTSSYSLSDSVWAFQALLRKHTFFVWKVGIMDSILDACIHDISSSDDPNFGFEQILKVQKKKVEIILLESMNQYLEKRVLPTFLSQLETEVEYLKSTPEVLKLESPQLKKISQVTREVQYMVEEYCDAHETARAGEAAISAMKRQMNELTEAVQKTVLEIVQMRWLHNSCLGLENKKPISPRYFADSTWASEILDLHRPILLQSMQSAMSSIARSAECIQTCERTCVSAEGQLERAMGWACGGPNVGGIESSSVKSSGIPAEFYDHLTRRRQFLLAAREKALDIMKICSSVLEFEASRDDLLLMVGNESTAGTINDGRIWQQAYMNALTRLDVTYHSFLRAEREWKLAKSSMEAAANELFSASSELSVASIKANSASGDLQDILASMRESACEASGALSAFARVTKGHTALTSECGPMLEEVLAITESLHDVHSLGKEAAGVHNALMDNISKVNIILLPLESMLFTDVAALSEAISRERESKMEIAPIHGQALHKSYSLRLQEVIQSLRPLVPSLTHSVRELHGLLTQLARTANVHAGNLHKALEGLGESQVLQSQGIALSRKEIENDPVSSNRDVDTFSDGKEGIHVSENAVQYIIEQDEWISPPDGSYSSSQGSSMTSSDANLSYNCVGSISLYEQIEYDIEGAQVGVGNDIDNPISGFPVPENSVVEESESQYADREKYGDLSEAPGLYRNEHPHNLPVPCEATRQVKKLFAEDGSPKSGNETATSNQHVFNHTTPLHTDYSTQIWKGKNAYALSVLRQVETKIEGQDIEDNREMAISEQVDHLLQQARNIDNLCNMYEGWTPWI